MKKPILTFRVAQYWNKLVRKFLNLFRRIEKLKAAGVTSSIEMSQMQRKLQSLFNRLGKMQNRVGIKIAGSAIALMLMSANLSAQTYTSGGPVTNPGNGLIDVGMLSVVSTGDIDEDGDLDIVAGEYFGSTMIYLNDGAGHFSFASPIIADGVVISVGYLPNPTMADVDEDGDLDLYVGTVNGTIKVYLNDGAQVFTAAPDMMANSAIIDVGIISSPEFADVDEDGDLDLYVGELYGNIKVFTNNGSGVFSAAGNLQAGGIDIALADIPQPTFFDLDNDGDLDLYAGDDNGAIKVFTNNGSGLFTAAPNLQSGGIDIAVGDYSSPAFLDLDDDGDMDLISGNYYGYIFSYINNGSGSFTDGPLLTANNNAYSFGYLAAPAFADIDLDGDEDLFVGKDNGTIATLINNGAGVFSLGANMMAAGIELSVGNFAMPEFADVDEDGDLDLYVGAQSGLVVAFENNGLGVFLAGVNLQAAGLDINVGSMASPAFADLDEDGDLDLYIGNQGGTIMVYSNDGTGLFTAVANFQADAATLDVGTFSSPLFTDIDADGDLDLLSGEYYGTVKVYLNNGSNVFSSSVNNFQADGLDVDVNLLSIPAMANTDGGCGPDLVLGGYLTQLFKYDYKDTLAPSITCPADINYDLLQWQANYTVSGTSLDPTAAADNCQIESVLNDFNGNSSLAGVDFPAGSETIVWTVTDVDGNTQTCSVDITVNVYNSIDDLSAMGISVFPNPSNGTFSITNAQNCNIQINDAFGKTILNLIDVQDAKLDLDLSNQPRGLYFITVSNKTDVRTAKIVIE